MTPINISNWFPAILLMVLWYTIWKQRVFLISLETESLMGSRSFYYSALSGIQEDGTGLKRVNEH